MHQRLRQLFHSSLLVSKNCYNSVDVIRSVPGRLCAYKFN